MQDNEKEEKLVDVKGTFESFIEDTVPEMSQEDAIKNYKINDTIDYKRKKKQDNDGDDDHRNDHPPLIICPQVDDRFLESHLFKIQFRFFKTRIRHVFSPLLFATDMIAESSKSANNGVKTRNRFRFRVFYIIHIIIYRKFVK